MTERKTIITEANDGILGYCFKAVHKSGMKIIVYPMKRSQSFVSLSVGLGGADERFEYQGSVHDLPRGSAHFLEHKMFECEGGVDGSTILASMGADSNAYTTETETVYLFSCTEHFDECLEKFLEIFTHPYFTEDSIESEKPIIIEEIAMYKDLPDDKLFYALLMALYKDHPVRYDIAGTKASVRAITAEVLRLAARAFYTPENMALSIAGPIDQATVMRICDKVLPCKKSDTGCLIPPIERESVNRHRVICRDDISTPKCTIGIKITDLPDDPRELARLQVIHRILATLLFGRSSKFAEDMYTDRIISTPLIVETVVRRGFGYTRITADTPDPDAMIDAVENYIKQVLEDGIPTDLLTACKRAAYGAYIADSDSPEAMSDILLTNITGDISPSELMGTMLDLTSDDLNALARKTLKKGRISIAVMLPRGEKPTRKENQNENA